MYMSSLKRSKVWLRILFLVFLGCFVIQIRESLEKYFSHKKATAMTTEVEDPMAVPEFTYCPGFRQDYVAEKFGMKLRPFENHYFTFFPNETEALMSWWRNITYGPKDVFATLMIKHDYIREIPEFNGGGNTAYIKGGMDLIEIPSSFGRCYTTHFVNPMPKGAIGGAWLVNGRSYGMYVHSRRTADLGLHFNNWKEEKSYFLLDSGVSYTFSLTKTRTKKLNQGDCSEETDIMEHVECAIKNIQQVHMNSNCSHHCWFPQARTLLSDLDLPPCLTKEDLKCNFAHLIRYLGSSNAYETGGNCPMPCQTTTYRVIITENRNFEFDDVISYAEVTSTDVAIAEEYLVFDENDILTALGGSLGLFLGFSCWGIAKHIIQRFNGAS